MRGTTKLRYALRAMVELARTYGMGPVMVETIALKQSISRKYLENLLTNLRNAGLVSSVRRSKGGYVLAIAPDKVTAYDVAVAVEGEIAVMDCVAHPGSCPKQELCPTMELWTDLSMQIRRILDAVTLQELMERYSKKLETISAMYYI